MQGMMCARSAMLGLLAVSLIVLQVGTVQVAAVTVCIPLGSINAQQCAAYFTSNFGEGALSYDCVAGTTAEGCMQRIKDGTADIANFGGEQLYLSNTNFGLVPVVGENYGTSGAGEGISYFGVAVVKKSWCDARTNPTFSNLKGQRSCHTGFRKASGWTLPVGYMTSSNVMPVVSSNANVEDDAETVASFFSTVCAPGGAPTSNGASFSGLCDGCGTAGCGSDSLYEGYAGAMRCLMEGNGDVAFVKQSSPLDYASDGGSKQSWSTLNKASMRLLCPSGGCVPLDQYGACNVAKAAARAFVARPYWASNVVGASVVQAMNSAPSTAVTAGVNLIDADYPVSADTKTLTQITGTFSNYFGASAVAAFERIRALGAGSSGSSVSVCIPLSSVNLAQCASYFNTNFGSQGVSYTCVAGGTDEGCMQRIQSGTADLANFGGEQLYLSNTDFGLVPVVGENYGTSGAGEGISYFGVAVVKKSWCDARTNPTFSNLKGQRSCHTGFRKASGWTLPVGYMTSSNVMPVVSSNANVEDDAETVASFFSTVCAPGGAPTSNGASFSGLCDGCGTAGCGSDSLYEGYAGAMRCLMEGNGDVAFVKQSSPLDYASDGGSRQAWSTLNQASMRLLCPSGGCVPLDQYGACNVAKAAARAFVARPNWASNGVGASVVQAMNSAPSTAVTAGVNLINADYPVSADTKTLTQITGTFSNYFGASAVAAFERIRALQGSSSGGSVSVCIPLSSVNLAQCASYFNTNFGSRGVSYTCVAGGTDKGCMQRIQSGTADLANFGGEQLYLSNTNFGLVPVVGENYGSSGAGEGISYFGVAVVKKSWCDARTNPTFSNLKGQRSCHTGFRKTSGWTLPVGYMTSSNVMPVVSSNANVEDDAETVASFFSTVCAPGGAPTSNGASFSGLCDGCGTAGCGSDSLYGGYAGALRCFMEGNGDVAFVKQSTPLDYASDGGSKQSWSTLNQASMRLLCPSGGCVPLDQYGACNVAKAAARAFVARPNWASNGVGASVVQAMNSASSSAVTAGVNLINADYPVSADTKTLTQITGTFSNYFGASAVAAFERIRALQGGSSGGSVSVCIPLSSVNLAQCASYFNTNFGSQGVSYTCVAGGTDEGCMQRIQSGTADIANFGGEQLYLSNTDFGLVPVVGENYGTSGAGEGISYFGVAVVKKSWCDARTNPTFSNLKGQRSCHTGFRKTSGWTLPVGYMTANNVMSVISSNANVADDAETVAGFFSSVCAPGGSPNTNGGTYSGLCSGCGQAGCGSDSLYEGYAGAMRCMMDGNGDVAFVKQSTPIDYARNGGSAKAWSTLNQNDMRLLCPNGGCVPLNQYDSCHIAKAAARAFVARPGWASAGVGRTVVLNMGSASNSAVSSGAGLIDEDYPVSADTESLTQITGSFTSYFGASAVSAFERIRSLEAIRVCIPAGIRDFSSTVCNNFFNNKIGGAQYICVPGGDDEGCSRMISNNQADITNVGGLSMYNANKKYGLVPVVGENYGSAGAGAGVTYFGVAVVKKSWCDAMKNPTFKDLKGLRSCHTGYRKTSGWTFPVGHLSSEGIMKRVSKDDGINNDAESVASFFSDVCAPGGKPRSDSGGSGSYEGICSGCGSAGCGSDSIYGDYSGALRCMMEDAGDVAFVKQSTPLDYASDGNKAETWSRTPMSDLRLLCPNGGCARVDSWADCNIARAAAHAFVARPGWADSGSGLSAVRALASASSATIASGRDMLVKSQPLSKDTQTMQRITESFEAYFGSSSKDAFENMEDINEPEEGGGGGGSDLSDGAIAGIVVGVSVFCILATATIVFFVMRKSQGHSHLPYPKGGAGSDSMNFATLGANTVPLSSNKA